jgi:hypothetical protein
VRGWAAHVHGTPGSGIPSRCPPCPQVGLEDSARDSAAARGIPPRQGITSGVQRGGWRRRVWRAGTVPTLGRSAALVCLGTTLVYLARLVTGGQTAQTKHARIATLVDVS